jgi:ABC-type antimicrobial peptide transport system permease subunit
MLLSDRFLVPALRLARHPSSTALAALVAAFGVALIVSLAALLGGLKKIGAEALVKGGAKVIRVQFKEISDEDLQAFADVDPKPLRVAPVSGYPCSVRVRGKSSPGVLMGTTPEVFSMYGLEVERGRALNADDKDPTAPGCVIDGGLAEKLFGVTDPLGAKIEAVLGSKRISATVRGVLPDLNKRAPLGLGGKIPSRTLYLQHEAIREQSGGVIHTALVEATDFDGVAPLVSSLTLLGKSRWEGKRFRVKHRQKQVKNLRKFTLMIDGLGLAIVVTTLLSCILSITTLQLLALRGRVGEVAIRVIEGATGAGVAVQLVIESALTTGVGALFGLPLGFVLAEWLSTVVEWPVVFSAKLAVAALLAATGAGVVAGTLPAWRAAELDPVHALKISKEAGC